MNKTRKRLLIIVGILFAVIIAFQGFQMFKQLPMFELKHLIVENNPFIPKENIVDLIHQYSKQSIYSLNVDKVKKALKENYFVEQVQIKQEWPDTIRVILTPEKIVAYTLIKTETASGSKDEYLFLGSNGLINYRLNENGNLELPKIMMEGWYSHEEGINSVFVKDSLRSLGHFQSLYPEFAKQITEIYFEKEGIKNFLKLKAELVKFYFHESLAWEDFIKLAILVNAEKKEQLVFKSYTSFDLRFDEKIIALR